MKAALDLAATLPLGDDGCRVAILGDMLELGPQSSDLHAALADDIVANGFDMVFVAGPMMRSLADALAGRANVEWRNAAADLQRTIVGTVKNGDVVIVKGSNGSRMAPIVEALKTRHAAIPSDAAATHA